jgi:hypothetical protein
MCYVQVFTVCKYVHVCACMWDSLFLIYIHIHAIHDHFDILAHTCNTWTFMHYKHIQAHTSTYIHTRTYLKFMHTHAHTYIPTHTCIHAHTGTSSYIPNYACMHMPMYMLIKAYTCSYIIHAHSYAYRQIYEDTYTSRQNCEVEVNIHACNSYTITYMHMQWAVVFVVFFKIFSKCTMLHMHIHARSSKYLHIYLLIPAHNYAYM